MYDTDTNPSVVKIHHPQAQFDAKQQSFFRPLHFPNSVPLEDADMVLFPWRILNPIINCSSAADLDRYHGLIKERPPNWSNDMYFLQNAMYRNVFQRLLKQFRKKNNIQVPLIVVTDVDDDGPMWETNDVFFFRASLLRQNRLPNEFIAPSLIEDREESWYPNVQGERPTVGFCGYPQHYYRTELLKYLRQHPGVEDDFIYRNSYFWVLQRRVSEEQLLKEYLDNLHRTAFMMSSRGGGNYSVRFYEALRSGRIPVLLESDMIFPFEEEIDWGEICICRPTPEEVAETMVDWWKNRDIAAIQKKCREVWEQFLSPPAFLSKMGGILKKAGY